MRAMDSGRQDGLPEERRITVWREEPTLAVLGEALAPAEVAVVDRGKKAVVDSELDSTLYRDITTFSNSNLVGVENLTVVPIEVTDFVLGHPVVSQTNPSEVVRRRNGGLVRDYVRLGVGGHGLGKG
ncbi:hypothetical protein V6N11_082382 [Hibiscus sabdariffa]|uniref:Uncharacterized protein n=1 Tax=Hibiscus sabdariffa TaxID=183260 RepID=A0ABR2PD60_9ROSI